MLMQPVTSSNVDSVGYDPVAKSLVVLFKNGAKWAYGGITEAMNDAFISAESIGSHLRKVIIPSATSSMKVLS